MVQDFLSFLRPLSPFKPKSKKPVRPLTRSGSTRTTSAASLSTLGCAPPLMQQRKPLTTKSSYGLPPYTAKVPASRSSSQSIIDPKRRPGSPMKSSLVDTLQTSILSPDSPRPDRTYEEDIDLIPIDSPEQLKTRDSEVFHISHIRKVSESRPKGHWTKIAKISITKRERQVFLDLRKSSSGPVRKMQVLSHCSWFPSNPRKDSGHRPLKLTDSRIGGSSTADERWEEDPFTGDVWSVKWVPSGSTTATTGEPEFGSASTNLSQKRIRDRSFFGKSTKQGSKEHRGQKTSVDKDRLQGKEISTIRFVR